MQPHAIKRAIKGAHMNCGNDDFDTFTSLGVGALEVMRQLTKKRAGRLSGAGAPTGVNRGAPGGPAAAP